jgi:probable phosphoglycerate mutase
LFGPAGGGTASANIDGGSRGNPGPAGYGVRVEREDGSVVELKEALALATNNVAEYSGLLAALRGQRPTESRNSTSARIPNCW